MQKNCPWRQTHVVAPYAHCCIAGTLHVMPGEGSAAGQLSKQFQLPCAQAQVVPLYEQVSPPIPVQLDIAAGCVSGQV